jgi:hypothetical protein
MAKYVVKRLDGSVVQRGDELVSFRGEYEPFYGCWHPRKITVGTDNAMHLYYPSVFDVTIEES